jgi:hypothetical protein
MRSMAKGEEMKRRIAWAAVVIGALPVACADMRMTPPPPDEICRSQACRISVSVGAKCAITARPEVLGIERTKRDVIITWELDRAAIDAGYEFRSNGIDTKGAGQFHGHGPDGRTKFRVTDNNTDAKHYKYDINVTKGSETCKKDPWIVNGA